MERILTRTQQSLVPGRKLEQCRTSSPTIPPALPRKTRSGCTSRSTDRPPHFPVFKQEHRSHTPEIDAQRVARNATPTTCPEYAGPPRRERSHACMRWTDCHNDECQIYPGDKQGSGWYPQFTRRSRKPTVAHDHDWRQEMEASPGQDWDPQQPSQPRARMAYGDIMRWEHCFNETCNEHRWEKVDAGYYPRQVGEKETLSKNDRREQRKRKSRENTAREGGE